MSQIDDFHRLRADLQKSRIQYLLADADLALTFATLAEDPVTEEPRRARLCAEARKAYVDIMKFAKDIPVDEPQLQELADKLLRLHSALEELGESVTD